MKILLFRPPITLQVAQRLTQFHHVEPLAPETGAGGIPDPHAFYDCMHALLPTRVPLRVFCRYLSLLLLVWSRHNPWRMNKVKVSPRGSARFMYRGMRCGCSVRKIYRDCQGQRFPKMPGL